MHVNNVCGPQVQYQDDKYVGEIRFFLQVPVSLRDVETGDISVRVHQLVLLDWRKNIDNNVRLLSVFHVFVFVHPTIFFLAPSLLRADTADPCSYSFGMARSWRRCRHVLSSAKAVRRVHRLMRPRPR